MAGDEGAGILDLAMETPKFSSNGEAKPAAAASSDYMAPWLETEHCTSCDECTKLNSKIFTYNNDKKAYIRNPEGGPYTDLVKAAEKCTAGVIHPGLPADKNIPDIEKWIKRAEKFN